MAVLAEFYDVEKFADGLEVIERLGQVAPPDVLVVDWVMTDMGGLEVIEFARAHPRTNEMAIVVLTSSIETANVAAALAAGADDFLRKPADPQELLARVARFVSRQVERESERLESASRSREERALTHEAQQRSREESQRADESSELARLSQLLMGILGHDLRTPLGAISIANGILARAETSPERRSAAAARIRSSISRMTEMIGQLMDLTRSRSGGGITVERRLSDVRSVCESVVAELRDAYVGREIRVDATADSAVAADPDRLAQVISNLVSNALQHGDPATPVSVTIQGDDGAITVHVHNSGPSISPELLPSLFDPFRRASERSSKATGGLGLGLYISKRIVEAHEGALAVRSDESGTLFSVRLPKDANRAE